MYVYLLAHKHTCTNNKENHEQYAYGQCEKAMHCAHSQRSAREMSLGVLYVCIFTCTQTHIYQRRKSWKVCIQSVRASNALRTFPKKCTRDESSRVICIFAHTQTHIYPRRKSWKVCVRTVRVSNTSRALSLFLYFFQRSVREISLVVSYGSSSWSTPWNVCMRSFDSENHTQLWRMHAEFV